MEDPGVVCILESLADLSDELDRRERLKRSMSHDQAAQIPVWEELRHQEGDIAGTSIVENSDDMGRSCPGKQARFSLKAFAVVVFSCEPRSDDLQRNVAVEPLVECFINDPHAAFANPADNPEAAEVVTFLGDAIQETLHGDRRLLGAA